MRALSAILLSLAIAAAIAASTTKKVKPRHHTYWCTNTGSIGTDGPCRQSKVERAI